MSRASSNPRKAEAESIPPNESVPLPPRMIPPNDRNDGIG